MATKTNVELNVNLQSGQIFIPAGRHVLPDSPYSDILQSELDSGASHITMLGTVDEADAAEGTDGTVVRGGRRKPTA